MGSQSPNKCVGSWKPDQMLHLLFRVEIRLTVGGVVIATRATRCIEEARNLSHSSIKTERLFNNRRVHGVEVVVAVLVVAVVHMVVVVESPQFAACYAAVGQ